MIHHISFHRGRSPRRQHSECQCRRPSTPCGKPKGASSGHATTCGVPLGMGRRHAGQVYSLTALGRRRTWYGAGVFLDRAGQTANLIVASVRALLRARHGSEAVHLQWTRFTPRPFLASFTSHATTVPRRNTRRTFSSLSTSTMSAFFPGESVPTVSSPRMAAPCADAM